MPTAKKKAAKKLDANKLFTINTISRAGIAELLNAALEDEDDVDHVMHFSDDDPRLTDKVCQEFANMLYDNVTETVINETEECDHNSAREFVHRFA